MKITPNDPPRTLTAAEIEAILPHRSLLRWWIRSPITPPASGRAASNA